MRQRQRPSPQALQKLLARLAPHFGERLVTGAAVCEQHGHGEGMREAMPPDAVVFPLSNEEVALAVRACYEEDVPVIAFGTGTSLEGHVQALHGGLCIDLMRLNRVLEVSAADLDCQVQAGVTREQLNREIRDQGLFFPIDPGADASLGGMAATRASGTNAVRYGTMRDNVLGLTVVTAEGRIVHTGGRARKSSAGYDLTRLFIGSEGTLGIITELRLKLYGMPEAISSAVCQFHDLAAAVNTVIMAMQLGIPVARIEILDERQMEACIRYSHLDEFQAAPTLFFEFHGSKKSVAEQAEQMQAVSDENGGSDYRWAVQPEERSRLWKARHNAYYASMAMAPGKEGFSTDACVPISRLAECLLETKIEAAATGLHHSIVGHVGDGNFHLLIAYDPALAQERALAEDLARAVALRAIRLGGTCTGEHGVGLHKLDFLRQEHGAALGLMRAIKVALDPRNLMNPGKTIPEALPGESESLHE
jgi:D-lactate dehydrogenase (cytochrome)